MKRFENSKRVVTHNQSLNPSLVAQYAHDLGFVNYTDAWMDEPLVVISIGGGGTDIIIPEDHIDEYMLDWILDEMSYGGWQSELSSPAFTEWYEENYGDMGDDVPAWSAIHDEIRVKYLIESGIVNIDRIVNRLPTYILTTLRDLPNANIEWLDGFAYGDVAELAYILISDDFLSEVIDNDDDF